MKESDKIALLFIVALLVGFTVGWYTRTQTADHQLVMAELKKLAGINSLIDKKIEQSITDYSKKRKGDINE
jgi:hypothetical protein